MRRGDVVILDFPFASGVGGKVRPAVIVQNDADNQRIRQTIVAMVTGNLRRVGEPTHVLIDPTNKEGAASGLHGKSLVVCSNLFTVDNSMIKRTIGQLSPELVASLDGSLKVALGLT